MPETAPNHIQYRSIYSVVLERAQKLAKLMGDVDDLIKLIRQKSAVNTNADKLIAEKIKAEKRLSELSVKVRKLFDSHAASIIDSRNYEMLMSDYQAEQATLTAKLQEINAELGKKEDYTVQLEKLKEAVADCLYIQELTPLILNKLIDRIEIGSQEVVDGQKQQEICIVWGVSQEKFRVIPEPSDGGSGGLKITPVQQVQRQALCKV